MIGRFVYGTCAVLLAGATAVVAQPPGSAIADSNANKQICRTMADTGSRLARSRACHTAREWIELRRQTKQNVDHIQNSRPFNGPG